MTLLPHSGDLVFFFTAAAILIVIPGPAVLYIVARSMDQGRNAGLTSAAGIATGGLVHVMAASLGLSALIVSSALAYSAIKYVGAAYLFYLGIKKFREQPIDADMKHAEPIPLRRVFSQGALVNILNPKTAIFFFAFLPQFVDPAHGSVALQFLTLGLIFTVMGFFSDSMWALTAGSAANWLRGHGGFLRNQRYVAGTVYMGLGLATAITGSKHK
jgi:threonine/homoserine/homoserine lactone efflux protein